MHPSTTTVSNVFAVVPPYFLSALFLFRFVGHNQAFAEGKAGVANPIGTCSVPKSTDEMSCEAIIDVGTEVGPAVLAVECGARRVPFAINFSKTSAVLPIASVSDVRSARLADMTCSDVRWAKFKWLVLTADDQLVKASGFSTLNSVDISFQGFASGHYRVEVHCTDEAGSTLIPAWYKLFALDYDPPRPSFDGQPPPVSQLQAFSLSLKAFDQVGIRELRYALCVGTCPPQSSLRWEFGCAPPATSGSGSFPATGVCECTPQQAGGVACSTLLTRELLPDGEHTVALRAVDLSGKNATATFSWKVDTRAPRIALSESAATGTLNQASVSVLAVDEVGLSQLLYSLCQGNCGPESSLPWTVACSESVVGGSGARCSCTPQQQGGVRCSQLVTLPKLKGEFMLAVLGTDTAGNNGSSYLLFDLVAPLPLVTQRPPLFSNSSLAVFVFSCSDGEGACGFEYKLATPSAPNGGSWNSLSLPVVMPNAPERHTLVNLVTRAQSVGDEMIVVTPYVSVDLSSNSSFGTNVFEYVICNRPCSDARLSQWRQLAPGVSQLPLQLRDGPYKLLARIAGESNLGSSHPTTSTEFSVRSVEPRTLVKKFDLTRGGLDLDLLVGVYYPGGVELNATAFWYSLDGGLWRYENRSCTLSLKVCCGPI